MRPKVAIIGLDGCPFDLVYDLSERGLLPTFKRIFESGSYGVLRSTIPPVSAVAWTSMFTGLNPGRHGVFSFREFIGPYLIRTICRVRGKLLWDIVSAAGRKVLVINVPGTYPPHKVSGVMISGFPAPSNRPRSYPPPIVKSLLKEKLVGYANF